MEHSDSASDRRVDRLILCDYMFEFVCKCCEELEIWKNQKGYKEQFQKLIEIVSGRLVAKQPYARPFKEFPLRTAALFDSLTISVNFSQEDNELIFCLETMYLAGAGGRKHEKGAGTLYAILQGMKMGCIYNHDMQMINNETTDNICIRVSRPMNDTTLVYLKRKENVPEQVSNIENCDLKLAVSTNGNWYWHIDLEFLKMFDNKEWKESLLQQNTDLASGISLPKPLIPLDNIVFSSEGECVHRVAHAISILLYTSFMKSKLSIIWKNSTQGYESWKQNRWQTPLVAAVFKELSISWQKNPRHMQTIPHPYPTIKISPYSASFHISFSCKSPFKLFGLLPELMHHMLERSRESVYEFGDILIKDITATEVGSIPVQTKSIRHDFLLYSDDPGIEKSVPVFDASKGKLDMGCLMCRKAVFTKMRI